MDNTLIFSPPPTPNGDLHVGHLSGPYLRADVYRRYLALQKRPAWLLCGADEHQTYVARKAQQLGLTPSVTADRFSADIQRTLRAAAIEVDHFARPRYSETHARMVEDFFLRLSETGKLIYKETDTLYCDACDRYLYEAFVHGRCPHCGEPSGGNACECCGRPNDCGDLIDPQCSRCGGRPSRRLQGRLHFPLQPYAAQLRRYYESAGLPARVRALCEGMLDDGLPEIAITHPSRWGLPVPQSGWEDQRLYVWFEMAPGLLAGADEVARNAGLAGGWQSLLQSKQSRMVTFCGYDNCFFYALMFPALFMAYDSEIQLSAAFVVNEFYRLDGSKFSTSRNHAIWGRQLLDDEPRDAVRSYLALSGPDTAQTNFTLEDYRAFVEQELRHNWRVWLQNLQDRLAANCAGRVPTPEQWTPQHRHFAALLESIRDQIADAFEAPAFSLSRAMRLCGELVRAARSFAESEAHWIGVPSGRRYWPTALALEVAAVRMLACCVSPIMPDFAARLHATLGGVEPMTWPSGVPWTEPGTTVHHLAEHLFDHEYSQLLSQRVDACA